MFELCCMLVHSLGSREVLCFCCISFRWFSNFMSNTPLFSACFLFLPSDVNVDHVHLFSAFCIYHSKAPTEGESYFLLLEKLLKLLLKCSLEHLLHSIFSFGSDSWQFKQFGISISGDLGKGKSEVLLFFGFNSQSLVECRRTLVPRVSLLPDVSFGLYEMYSLVFSQTVSLEQYLAIDLRFPTNFGIWDFASIALFLAASGFGFLSSV